MGRRTTSADTGESRAEENRQNMEEAINGNRKAIGMSKLNTVLLHWLSPTRPRHGIDTDASGRRFLR